MTRKNPPPELKSFSSLASFHLHKLSRLSGRIHEQHYQRLFGLSLREYRIVGMTGAMVDASFRRICEESNLDKAHVSRLINRLVQRKLLFKTIDPDDQRSVRVSLTDKGVALHRSLFEESSRLNDRWLAVLSEPERVAFMAALERLELSAQQMAEGQRDSDSGAPPRSRKKTTALAAAKRGTVQEPTGPATSSRS